RRVRAIFGFAAAGASGSSGRSSGPAAGAGVPPSRTKGTGNPVPRIRQKPSHAGAHPPNAKAASSIAERRPARAALRFIGNDSRTERAVLWRRSATAEDRMEYANLAAAVWLLRSGSQSDSAQPADGPAERAAVRGRVRAVSRDAAREASHAAVGVQPTVAL